MRKLLLVLTVIALLAMAGCIQTGYDRFVDKGKEEGWTAQQIEAAYDYFLKSAFMVKGDDGRYTIDTTKISVEDAYQMAGNILNDLDHVLGTSDANWQKLMKAMPSAKLGFEREEQRWLYIQSQLGQVKTYLEFRDMLGYRLTAKDKQYDIAYLWPDNVHTNFTADYLEQAKANGTLKEVEREFVYLYTPYGYKDPDPANPDDKNAFIWRPKLQGYLIVSYAILNSTPPKELRADYCEIFRASLNGVTISHESQPCLRAFRTLSGTRLEVVVLDYDREGEGGFGIVDKVYPVNVDTGSELYDTYPSIFRELADSRTERTARNRDWPEPELTLRIVRVGDVEEWRGDFNEDGWTVPYEYRDEYAVDWSTQVIKVDKPDGYPFDKIKYVVKRWKNNSVWEYYEPNEAYSGEMENVYGSGHSVYAQPRGEATKAVYTDKVCGALKFIIYRDGGEWVKIADLDGTGKLQYKVIGVADPRGVRVSSDSSAPHYGY